MHASREARSTSSVVDGGRRVVVDGARVGAAGDEVVAHALRMNIGRTVVVGRDRRCAANDTRRTAAVVLVSARQIIECRWISAPSHAVLACPVIASQRIHVRSRTIVGRHGVRAANDSGCARAVVKRRSGRVSVPSRVGTAEAGMCAAAVVHSRRRVVVKRTRHHASAVCTHRRAAEGRERVIIVRCRIAASLWGRRVRWRRRGWRAWRWWRAVAARRHGRHGWRDDWRRRRVASTRRRWQGRWRRRR